MDLFTQLVSSFQQILSPIYLLFITIGVIVGLIVGTLPGLGPTAAIAILLPLTFNSDPVLSLVMLTGIYYGAMFGGSFTSILLNIPGESSAVFTAEQGFRLAKRGKGAEAVQMSTIASFLGGTISVLALTFVAPVLGNLALNFGPPEYFLLMLMGLSCIAFVGMGSPVKGLIAGCIGLMLGTIGSEPITGAQRFTFGSYNLGDGLPFPAVAMGLFAIAEVFASIEDKAMPFDGGDYKGKMKIKFPSKEDFKISAVPATMASILGFMLGSLPGIGPTIATFISYGAVKATAKDKAKWENEGAMEGVAAVEAANNAAVGGAMVPLLSLGIPGTSAAAVLLAGFMMHGVRPGPLLFADHPEIPWGIISSMYIGNLIAMILGIICSIYVVKILKMPPAILNVIIIAVTMVGAYSLNNNMFNVYVLLIFGLIGYFLKKAKIPEAPIVLGLVLGPLVETAFGQSLIMSYGSLSIFVERPISAVLVGALAVIVSLPILKPFIAKMKMKSAVK
jgi:putative tricarboxylic transport membrane protein